MATRTRTSKAATVKVSSDVLKKSVTLGDLPEGPQSGGIFHILFPAMSMSSGPSLGPFWTPERDWQLYQTIFREGQWANAIFKAISKMASQSFEVDGDVPTRVRKAREMLMQFDAERGWVPGLAKHLQAFLLTGNGAALEIVHQTGAPGSKVLGLIHLDTFRVTRTGDPDFPAIYRDAKGREHVMKAHQVMLLSDMPDQSELWYGVGHCLKGDSRVRFADGSTPYIRDIVRKRMTGPVASLGSDGTVVSKAIIGWHENPIAGRGLVNLRGSVSSRATGRSHRNVWLTGDHPVLTPMGYRRADAIQDGDPITTEWPGLNEKQLQLVIASVLGDAHIDRRYGGRARISWGHSQKQADWLRIKVRVLPEFGICERTNGGFVWAQSKAQPALIEIHEQCYDAHGKKCVPPDLLIEHLSPFLLAVWYLDDGWITDRNPNPRNRSARAHIGNAGGPPGNSDEFAAILRWAGFECSTSAARKGRDVHFSVAGSAAFFQTIGPYVPPSMRYKVPDWAPPFDAGLWNPGTTPRFVDQAVVEARKGRADCTVYCVDVEETHNFISSGIVVHNCAAERAYKAIIRLEAIENYLYEKTTGKRPLAIHIVNGVNEAQLRNAVLLAKQDASAKGLITYMGAAIVAMVDPTATPSVATIDLASLPDGFEAMDERKNAYLTYANAIGIDPQLLDPDLLASRAMGTGAQSKVIAEKMEGIGLSAWRKQFEHQINEHALDEKTTFAFEEVDLDAKRKEADTKAVWATILQTLTVSSVITSTQALQMGVDWEIIPEEFLPEDMTPDTALTDEAKPEGEALLEQPQPAVPVTGVDGVLLEEVMQTVRSAVGSKISEARKMGQEEAGRREAYKALQVAASALVEAETKDVDLATAVSEGLKELAKSLATPAPITVLNMVPEQKAAPITFAPVIQQPAIQVQLPLTIEMPAWDEESRVVRDDAGRMTGTRTRRTPVSAGKGEK